MKASVPQTEGGVRGGPLLILRLEGLGVLALCAFLYHQTGLSWWWFAGLFLAPDLSFLVYVFGRAAGTAAYNATHTELAPLAVAILGMTILPGALPFALIGAPTSAGTGWPATG